MTAGGAGRRVLVVVAAVVGAVVVLAAALILLLQTGAVSRRVKDLVVPRASAALGRELTVKDAKLRVFPTPRVDLTQAAIAGRPGELPLVELQSLEVSLRLWPLVRSLGREVEVASIRLVQPVLNLVRAPDGTWNYEGLGKGGGATQEGAPPPAPEAAQPGDRKVVVEHAGIDDGSVRLVDRAGAGGEAAVAISRIQLSADHVGVGEPLEAKLAAAIAGTDQNFQARIHADRLPASVAALAPGSYPKLEGEVKLSGLDLARLRGFLPASVTGMMTGGRVDADAQLSTRGQVYAVDGKGKLGAVRLRGEPAEGGFELHATLDPAKGALHARIDKLALKGPGVDLGGNATVEAAPLKVRFAIAGPLLDLGQVLGLLPPSAPKPKGAPVLSAEQRRAVKGLDVAGTIDIAKVVKGGLVATNFKARTALEHSTFLLQDARADLFGGRVDASGTRFDLAQEVPTWNLKSKLEGVDLGQALTSLGGAAPVVGNLNGTLALDGAGVEWAKLREALTGQGAVALKEGALTTADLGGDVLGAVAKGLRAVGKSGAAGAVSGAAGKTQLRDLAASFTVKDGSMALSRPLTFTAPFGSTNLGGRIGLDGQLGLEGTASVSKQALASVIGTSGIALPASLQVPLAIKGSLGSPSVSVDAGKAVGNLVGGAVRQQTQQLKEKATEEAGRAARRGLGDVLKRFGQ